jgi:hypothetical protein
MNKEVMLIFIEYVTIEKTNRENKTNERKLLVYACLKMEPEIELVVKMIIKKSALSFLV